MRTNICDNISQNEAGHLLFGGQDVTELAKKYGTPLYLMDEDKIREKCRIYKKAFKKYFNGKGTCLYASKACSFKRMYSLMEEEHMGVDVASMGEIYTAMKAGFKLEYAYFNSNNKTDEDIAFAMDHNVGVFVVDNVEEVYAIEAEASGRNFKQEILLRLTPGIDPHTYEAIATGKVDSKFGTAIETGQADEIIAVTLQQPHIHLRGFHCHVGSQVFEEDIFERAVVVMLEYIAHIKEKYGYMAEELDMGGGYGVRYVDSDPYLYIDTKVGQVSIAAYTTCERLGIEMPYFTMEPGRSIVADSGMTLYTVGTVKRITGYKNYVSIDGGMTDNPRFALYGSNYTCLCANKQNEEHDFTADLVGRCCESGDIIQKNVSFPDSVQRNDIVAVCTTGAYNYSMASNYNRICRPAVVMLSQGDSYVAVKRESLDDLTSCDL